VLVDGIESGFILQTTRTLPYTVLALQARLVTTAAAKKQKPQKKKLRKPNQPVLQRIYLGK
jgi:hypothetical protein